MCQYNANEILEKVNELPSEEAMELISGFTMLNLMQIINHADVYSEYMDELNENILRLTRISNGLSKVFAEMNVSETGSH